MKKFFRILAIALLFINGFGALWGGFGLIYDPTGQFMQMPLELIKHSPFDSYLIPGIILLVFNGFLSLITLFLTFSKYRYYPFLLIFQGLVLVTWLTVQIIMIKIFYAPLHLPFYFVATALIISGFILSKKNA